MKVIILWDLSQGWLLHSTLWFIGSLTKTLNFKGVLRKRAHTQEAVVAVVEEGRLRLLRWRPRLRLGPRFLVVAVFVASRSSSSSLRSQAQTTLCRPRLFPLCPTRGLLLLRRHHLPSPPA